MGLVLYDLNSRWLSPEAAGGFWFRALTLGGVILAGVAIYFLMARIFRCPEISSITGMVLPMLRKSRQ
jgi:hypothetical protein